MKKMTQNIFKEELENITNNYKDYITGILFY